MDVECTVVIVNIYKRERNGGYTLREIEVMLGSSY